MLFSSLFKQVLCRLYLSPWPPLHLERGSRGRSFNQIHLPRRPSTSLRTPSDRCWYAESLSLNLPASVSNRITRPMMILKNRFPLSIWTGPSSSLRTGPSTGLRTGPSTGSPRYPRDRQDRRTEGVRSLNQIHLPRRHQCFLGALRGASYLDAVEIQPAGHSSSLPLHFIIAGKLLFIQQDG